MPFEIKHTYSNRVLFSSDTAKDLREAIIEAAKARADLRSADLSGANLSGANLSGANLYGADLSGANLSGANLYGADLRSADLRSADLSGANLSGANLSGADLRSADLRSANLYGANLSGADLSGADLYGANLSGADLRSADLRSANLYGADLSGANLSGADLYGANLSGADLRSANLSGANLSGANLYGADLSGAKGFNKYAVQTLNFLRDQPGKVRLYKVVTSDYMSPMYHTHYADGALNYKNGARLTVDNANENEDTTCGAGINVAPLDWCIRQIIDDGWFKKRRIMIVEFTANDIAAIPTAGQGKIRLHRCKVVGEIDYETYGIAHLAGPTADGIDPATKEPIPTEIPF